MVTNIVTSLQYINLIIHYFLRGLKDKLVSRKDLPKENGKPKEMQKWKYSTDQEILMSDLF
jgi:hypothetical protein